MITFHVLSTALTYNSVCVLHALPAGTGKTTVARRMGAMFKQLGVLQSDEVVSCSPADFTIGYAGGQAAKKTQSILQKALGKTLFIDEAYGTLLSLHSCLCKH
jgi:ATPase family associated with various cellular activities (AAA)